MRKRDYINNNNNNNNNDSNEYKIETSCNSDWIKSKI